MPDSTGPSRRDHLLLFINGQPIRVRGEDAFLPLSEFLRRRRRLVGTKVVCAEGDCGSCSVLLGRVRDGELQYRAITSCIQLMLQLDGAHIVTVEGLRQSQALNPIQQALVQCQGTQCGFCTPGFVVAMYDTMRDNRPCDAHTLRRGLVGNLCRCTGYDSIIRAGLSADRSQLKSLDALYPPGPIVEALAPVAHETVDLQADERQLYKPTTVDDAIAFLSDNPGAVVLSGGTDLGVLENKRVRRLTKVLSTASLNELRGVKVESETITVGAAATLTELERITLEHIPAFGEYLAWFGSPLIKNAGTIAGNLVTASPIGDTAPVLFVLGAEIELAGPSGRRRMPVEQFQTGYRKTALQPGELVVAVRIPRLREGETLKLYKVSRRKDLDISSFSAAFCLMMSGDRIDDLRIAYGGVAATTLRMQKTEAVLRRQRATREVFERAAAVARDEVTPMSDVRGSEQYRRTLAGQILLKLWHELTSDGNDSQPADEPNPTPVGGALQPALARKEGA